MVRDESLTEQGGELRRPSCPCQRAMTRASSRARDLQYEGPVIARILYVDDDLELTRLVQCCLEDEGYEVLIANDGEEGLGSVITEQPDMVILDVMMPQLNGWEIAKYILSSKNH